MSPQVTAAIIAAGVGVLTVIATVAVQISGRRATSRDTQKALEEQRKQLDRTLAEQRTRTLNERFATAAGQLGSDKPPAVRLAGVYAMAGLADDWPENRQTCVDVLCAYLRLPYEPDPGDEASGPERLAFRASREVRLTVIRVITAHLQEGAAVSWQGLDFDFAGVVFDGGDFGGAKFSGGEVSFIGARFSGGRVSFDDAEFSGAEVSFDSAVFSGGTVSFAGARFSGGTVSFDSAEFFGAEVSFDSAVFSGGTVDFSEPGDWSAPPAFPWTGTPPPGVKLPRGRSVSDVGRP
jgi:Pentapeptide repeats (9 copies)